MRVLKWMPGLLAAILAMATLLFLSIGRERSWELIAGSADRGRIDVLHVERSPTANDALAATPPLAADPDIVLPAFEEDEAALMQRLAGRIAAVDPLARRVDDGSIPGHLRYVTHSPNMRFPDYVTIEAFSLEDGRTGIVAYAAAQLGQYDFGANRRRLELYFDIGPNPTTSRPADRS
jgi:hypothetical protein